VEHWFEELADHMGEAYLRYSFTKGTVQEIDFLVEELDLPVGARVLDVGCGPGRHCHELARRGFEVVGVDISSAFVKVATERASDLPGATFVRADARDLPFDHPTLAPGFDAVVCLCQGAFGLMTVDGDDRRVLDGIRRALRPGGRFALSAFSAYFSVRYHEAADFDADRGLSHEKTTVKSPDGRDLETVLWTGCYTPRELRLLLAETGLEVDAVHSVEPGAYGRRPATIESPEFLVCGRRPG
jgi:SAM-dependent methyltransferase